MTASQHHVADSNIAVGDRHLAERLARAVEGEVLFDRFTRGRYSTDASIYQIEPIGVLVPRNKTDVIAALAIAAEEGVPVLPRGAGTSQAGQTVGRALVIDTSKYLTTIGDIDEDQKTVRVEPGVVLDQLNAQLRSKGLFFPVDVATAAQATLGGMAGNNSAGARSIRYGIMADNVRGIDALLIDGTESHFGATPPALADLANASPRYRELVGRVRAVYARERHELDERVPRVLRNVAGYNLHRVSLEGHNMAELLVGSEGTLAFFTGLELALQPLPPHRALGVCHFPTLHQAMDSVQHIVTLDPTAVELVDRTLLDLAGKNATFRDALTRFVRGSPAALLLVEFSADTRDEVLRDLRRLNDAMADLGFPNAVVDADDPAFQAEIWAVRKAGLNIVMSMKGNRKPVSFVEDCAVPLEHLAEYTDRLGEIFWRHRTTGTFYAHASVGCLHVRPALDLKDASDVETMRAIASEVHEVVRHFGGSHSGEHGDGLVRSEFLEPALGTALIRAFEEVKGCFDPAGLFNPGKIVNPTKMDDRILFRYGPDYGPAHPRSALDWSDWGDFTGAVEMCNNNGACRKLSGGVMCPSYRVTRDEQHVTRGRANSLRLALTGQLGADALASDELYRTMDLCVGCKACRRECPAGVDMARMKTEVLHHHYRHRRRSLRDRLTAYLPRYAPWAARLRFLANARDTVPLLRSLSERLLGYTAKRPLPEWRRDWFRETTASHHTVVDKGAARDVVLFVDTFNTYFEPENARAAKRVLERAGYNVIVPAATSGSRPLCCGRTFLNAGLVDHARAEAERLMEALVPLAIRGIPVVGLEPSCLLTLRDEFLVNTPGSEADVLAERAFLFEEFLVREADAGHLNLVLSPVSPATALLHGHCHQKAFGLMGAVERVLGFVPELTVQTIESGCCGMAGSFGYEAEHYELSMQMAELDLLPAVRKAPVHSWVIADGVSCRHQIADGTGRQAVHVARLLEAALP